MEKLNVRFDDNLKVELALLAKDLDLSVSVIARDAMKVGINFIKIGSPVNKPSKIKA